MYPFAETPIAATLCCLLLLVSRYGFATDDNPHDIVNIDANIALAVFEKYNNGGEYGAWLLQIEEVFGDDKLFEFDRSCDPPDSLVFLVHCVVNSTRRFRRGAESAVIHAAQVANRAKMLTCSKTLNCLIHMLFVRLQAHGHRHRQGTPLLKLLDDTQKLVKSQELALERAKLRSRSPHRTSAMILRVCEQRLLLGALEALITRLDQVQSLYSSEA